MLKFKEFLSEMITEKLITFGGQAYPKFGQVVILAGGAGCYPKGTEFFTGLGWKDISKYQEGDKVLQFNPNNDIASLVEPDEFINLPVDRFHRIKNNRVDFTTSNDHKHLVINEKTGKYDCVRTHEIVDKHNTRVRGNKRKLVTSFNYNGGGIELTDDQIRLKVSIYADGHILPTKQPKVRVSLKKEHKIDRMRYLLDINGVSYREYEDNGFTRFEFNHDSKEKEFNDWWYQCNYNQLKVVCDECIKWDGSIVARNGRKDMISFHSTSVKSRDFIQFAFSATGHDTHISVDERKDRNTCYGVYVNHSNGVGISKNDRTKNTTIIEDYESDDGRMYCFSVPTGFFVVRQKGKIYVSGNSGKGFVLSNLIGIEGNTLDVDALKALAIGSDKFAARIKDETGHDIKDFDLRKPENVSKIHELLSDIYGIVKANQRRIFSSVLAAPSERKPNLIFDVTLKDMGKLESITRNAQELGYSKENIHIVWVVNDINIALKQNRDRSRVVPEEILISTHEGASLTMQKIISMDKKLSRYMDGQITFAFNKAGVDTELVKSGSGGQYIKDANYITMKEKGRPPMRMSEIEDSILNKIRSYTPDIEDW